MIPTHFINGKNSKEKQGTPVEVETCAPDMTMFDPSPTELGTISETVTKSTVTETVMTRITDTHLSEALISEVNIGCQ